MILRSLTYLLVGISLVACGVKGDLKPTGLPDPAAPAALSIRQQGDTILLHWDIPTRNQDGSPLADLAGFRIDLYSYSPESYCPECRDQETLATIRLSTPDPAVVKNGTAYYRAPVAGFDLGTRYRVVPFSEGGRSGRAAEARIVSRKPPREPVSVSVTEFDRGVKLTWSLPTDVRAVGDLLGVNIYAARTDAGFDREPVNRKPVSETEFDHFGLENDIPVRYGLRTVVRIDDAIVESSLSRIVVATPQAGL